MHAVTFQLKRGHLSAVAMGRRLFKGTRGTEGESGFDGVPDMTPARFDILYVAFKTEVRSQRDLCERLGLHSSTISEAVQRLVELGLVESSRAAGDGRKRGVSLTSEGRRRLKRALHLLFTRRPIARHMRAFALRYVERRPRRGLTVRIDEALLAIWEQAVELARHFGNQSARVHVLPRSRWGSRSGSRRGNASVAQRPCLSQARGRWAS